MGFSRVGIAISLLALGFAGLSGTTGAAASGCLAGGTDATIQAALTGPGAAAQLCPGATFELAHTVRFTAPDQRIETAGLPTGDTRATLRVADPALTSAVNGVGQAGATVRNVRVDGNRPALGHLDGNALLEMGGTAGGQLIREVQAYDTRSWSTLHLFEGSVTDRVPGCQNARVLDNTFGPAGMPDGTWADGISLACGHTLVRGNTIRDATDGAIVVFGAPGSTVENNRIVAETRTLLGGINMVDFAPVGGNYAGTVVAHNVIDAKSAYIKVGIAMGPQVWACWDGTNSGATVAGNTLQGRTFGYGYAVNGVTDWTVSGNVDRATHVGTPVAGCGGLPSPPAGFQVESATNSSLQKEFVTAKLHYVLAVTP